jgi:hypothetical protein
MRTGSGRYGSRGTYVVTRIGGTKRELGRASTLAEAKRIAASDSHGPVRRWRETGYSNPTRTEWTSDDSDCVITLSDSAGGGGARAKADAVQIVLAWVTEDFRVVRERRRDLGERPELEKFNVGKAAMWLNRGTDADVAKARAYARAESDSDKTIHVFVYPSSVKDPLGAAKKDVLRMR